MCQNFVFIVALHFHILRVYWIWPLQQSFSALATHLVLFSPATKPFFKHLRSMKFPVSQLCICHYFIMKNLKFCSNLRLLHVFLITYKIRQLKFISSVTLLPSTLAHLQVFKSQLKCPFLGKPLTKVRSLLQLSSQLK